VRPRQGASRTAFGLDRSTIARMSRAKRRPLWLASTACFVVVLCCWLVRSVVGRSAGLLIVAAVFTLAAFVLLIAGAMRGEYFR